MRFSVDAHAIGRHLTGNEVYVRNLLRGFAQLDHHSEFLAYVCGSPRDIAEAVPQRVRTRRVAANPFVRLGYDLSRQLRRDCPDLIHVQYTAPLACPVPVIASVHDVCFLECPQYFTRSRAAQLRITVKRTVERAVRVIAPSEFSRKSVLKAYNLPEDRVVTVPIAASSAFRPVARAMAAGKTRRAFGFDFPFVLTVGDLQPRKNQIGLIHAFEALLRDNPHLPHHLVIVGKRTWFADRIHAVARGSAASERIHFTGFVEDDMLLHLYNACDVFIFPSFYEGFGLPVLEAMACGRAVACSNVSSIPEVADACAILFDPGSVSEMCRALRDLLINQELRGRMERLGLQRASLFSWDTTARRTLDLYYEVAVGRRGAPLDAAARPAFSD